MLDSFDPIALLGSAGYRYRTIPILHRCYSILAQAVDKTVHQTLRQSISCIGDIIRAQSTPLHWRWRRRGLFPS